MMRIAEADLTEAKGLTQDQLDSAKGDDTTQLPTGLNPPERWSHAPVSELG